jgi:transposase
MFIKATRNASGQTYYHLVESYRDDDGKSRHRTLLSLGRKGEDQIDNLLEAIAKHRDVLTAAEMAKAIDIKDTYILGPLLVLERLFEISGIDKVLGQVAKHHPKLGFDLRQAVFTMAAARFVRPGSKLKIFEKEQKRLYPGMVNGDLELHQLYRTLDILSAHKDEIEHDLFWHDRDLLAHPVDVVLYDLTTLRFESTVNIEGTLRRFGYSKEMRSDCTQVVLGLMVTPEGIPLGFEVYPGNTFEGLTVRDIAHKMRDKFKVRRFIFVADRGLFSANNLDVLREQNGEFIVGMKLGVFRDKHDIYYDGSKLKWLNDDLGYHETEHKGDRVIITWSRVRAERDQKSREDVVNKIRKKLSGDGAALKKLVTHSSYRKYVKEEAKAKLVLDEGAIAEEAKRDGYFGIITNIKGMKAEDIVANYKTLWEVEDAFGELKGTLKARPVFHWSDDRIIGHLTLCFMAYLCEALMTKSLREKGFVLDTLATAKKIIEQRPLTVVEAMRELNEVRAIPVTLRGKTTWVRTDIAGNANKLLAAVGRKPPPKVLNLASKSSVL